jgi:prepilin-type N-terminal cleavage/methylation domain-containing protein
VRRRATRRGLTLIEVMISLLLLGGAAFAGLSAMLFGYRRSEATLRELGALACARAVLEQIAALDFDTLAGTTLPVDIPSSSTGSLTVNTWNNRSEDIHGTTSTADDLQLSIRPEVTRSNSSTLFSCAQIIVRYRWTETAFFSSRTREESLTLVASQLEAY